MGDFSKVLAGFTILSVAVFGCQKRGYNAEESSKNKDDSKVFFSCYVDKSIYEAKYNSDKNKLTLKKDGDEIYSGKVVKNVVTTWGDEDAMLQSGLFSSSSVSRTEVQFEDGTSLKYDLSKMRQDDSSAREVESTFQYGSSSSEVFYCNHGGSELNNSKLKGIDDKMYEEVRGAAGSYRPLDGLEPLAYSASNKVEECVDKVHGYKFEVHVDKAKKVVAVYQEVGGAKGTFGLYSEGYFLRSANKSELIPGGLRVKTQTIALNFSRGNVIIETQENPTGSPAAGKVVSKTLKLIVPSSNPGWDDFKREIFECKL